MPVNKGHDTESVGSDNERTPKSTYEIYRAEADSLLRNSEFVKATKSYTKALELRPGDRHCLVNRSKCHLRNDMTDEALKDVEESFKDYPNYYKGIYQKAEVLYFKGDFETALVYYHRGNKLRPELEDFRLGIQKAEEAINNSVGDAQVQLTCDGDLTYFYQHQESDSKKKAKKARGGYARQKQAAEKKKVERKKQSMDEKTQKKLLGCLYKDMEFLNHMVKDENRRIAYLMRSKHARTLDEEKFYWFRMFIEQHTTHKTQNSEEINTLAIEALNFLESRTEFWQQQSPARGSGSKRGESGGKIKSASSVQPSRYVLNGLEEIDHKHAIGQTDEALKQAHQLMRTVEAWTTQDLPNKFEVLANLYSVMGNCYLDLANMGKAMTCHKKDLEIGKANQLDDAVSRALDNIGRVHAKSGDYQSAIDTWQEKIPKSQSSLESAWLLHEIGRCYLELGEFGKAKEYGEKSLVSAQEIEDNSWMLNASVLIAQTEVKLEDYQNALDSFERALERAELLNNKDAEAAIKKAINEVNAEIVQKEKEKEENANENNDEGQEQKYEEEFPEESDHEQEADHSQRDEATSSNNTNNTRQLEDEQTENTTQAHEDHRDKKEEENETEIEVKEEEEKEIEKTEEKEEKVEVVEEEKEEEEEEEKVSKRQDGEHRKDDEDNSENAREDRGKDKEDDN